MHVCRSCPQLLVANHKDYTNKIKRNDAIVAIGTTFNMDAVAVKLKIKSFRSFQRKKIILPNGLPINH